MAEKGVKKRTPLKLEDYALADKYDFPPLRAHPIDDVSPDLYRRIEVLVDQYVFRSPSIPTTLLAKPGAIGSFCVEKGAGKKNKAQIEQKLFNESFLVPLEIEAESFRFSYGGPELKRMLDSLNLSASGEDVLTDLRERGVFLQESHENASRKDSCVESVFRHVRNALAHGRIAAFESDGEAYLFLEDGTSHLKVLRRNPNVLAINARALLKISTLEQWYSTLQEGRIPEGE